MDFPFVKEAISQLFSRSSCEMYPAVPREAAPGYRGRIVYHADKCIGCGMCERVCSGNAITRTVEKVEEGDRITLTFNLGSCTFCATCADFCSTKAIEFSGLSHDSHKGGGPARHRHAHKAGEEARSAETGSTRGRHCVSRRRGRSCEFRFSA